METISNLSWNIYDIIHINRYFTCFTLFDLELQRAEEHVACGLHYPDSYSLHLAKYIHPLGFHNCSHPSPSAGNHSYLKRI